MTCNRNRITVTLVTMMDRHPSFPPIDQWKREGGDANGRLDNNNEQYPCLHPSTTTSKRSQGPWSTPIWEGMSPSWLSHD